MHLHFIYQGHVFDHVWSLLSYHSLSCLKTLLTSTGSSGWFWSVYYHRRWLPWN